MLENGLAELAAEADRSAPPVFRVLLAGVADARATLFALDFDSVPWRRCAGSCCLLAALAALRLLEPRVTAAF